ncbi:lysine--tRNA ligase [Prosthecobacter dejongeii]|uniref:Lysine--tRNA ligase n=1 Tax=Prosthecobacter dejongeii TaxID=48465 RepID=A0A7W7YPX7_9BACT|nr:lysine--tRNA ligase [Prosthecobacter dejongeii]MBB5040042.1 lysyl-tRNA synthetase class 2 [Prosthecobacter dejongeii]
MQPAPEHTESELLQFRRHKLEELQKRGIAAFGGKFDVTHAPGTLKATFTEGLDVRIAGRILSRRQMGKATFFDIGDITGRIQCYLSKNDVGDEAYDLFVHQIDIGDFVAIEGLSFVTKKGENSIHVKTFTPMSKALRPLPDKWHGIADREIKYRQRYLDLISNEQSREIFVTRSKMVAEIRSFLNGRDFLEVETPMMQDVPGGAAARPFETYFNALDQKMYLRIAPELYLKRLLVGGFTKVYELNRNFRNEGVSRRHNPEFTMLEAYWAYSDFEQMADLVESLVCHLAEKFCGGLKIKRNRVTEIRAILFMIPRLVQEHSLVLSAEANAEFQAVIAMAHKALNELDHEKASAIAQTARTELGRFLGLCENDLNPGQKGFFDAMLAKLDTLSEDAFIDLSRPWKRTPYRDLIKGAVGDDWFSLSKEAKVARAQGLGVHEIHAGDEHYELDQKIFEKLVEEKSFNPLFVTHVPKELVPLAKQNTADDSVVDVYELVINGQEISPGYSELNDPIVQRQRLEHQAGEEIQKIDEEFILALEHGMPPAGGIGIGIDRLIMMLTGAESIRDVVLFPQLKRKAD